MIIVPQPPGLMAFRDDANRADNASDAGTMWQPAFDSIKVVTNRLQCSTPASNTGRQGAWEYYIGQTGDHNGGRLLTDNWAIEAQLIAPVGGAATDNLTTIGGAMLDNGPASGMVLVYMSISTGANHGILTYANSTIAAPGAGSGQVNQTVRSSGGNVATTALIRFERRMYSATQSNFLCYVNGSFTVGWNDSTGVVPAGDRLKRRWFIQDESNFPLFQQAFYSPAIDWVRAYDLKL